MNSVPSLFLRHHVLVLQQEYICDLIDLSPEPLFYDQDLRFLLFINRIYLKVRELVFSAYACVLQDVLCRGRRSEKKLNGNRQS